MQIRCRNLNREDVQVRKRMWRKVKMTVRRSALGTASPPPVSFDKDTHMPVAP